MAATKTQSRYLSYINAYIEAFGVSPSQPDIARALQVSPPSVCTMLKKLEDIPEWEKRIDAGNLKQWTIEPPRRSKPQTATTEMVKAYRLKLTLQHMKPPVWRRIEVPDVSVAEFADLILRAMGWMNCHMHQFRIGDEYLVSPESFEFDMHGESYAALKVSDLFQRSKVVFFDYDFGDGWEHKLELEATTKAPSHDLPRCTGGRQACPPEDIGGPWGFANFLEAIGNPNHPEPPGTKRTAGTLWRILPRRIRPGRNNGLYAVVTDFK